MTKDAKILFISDIHYCNEYENLIYDDIANKSAFEFMWDKFMVKVKELNPTHIIINGDLLFSGIASDYSKFKEYIKKLYDIEVPIMFTPGNHDVEWSGLSQAYDEYVSSNPNTKFIDFLYSINEEIFTTKHKYLYENGYKLIIDDFNTLLSNNKYKFNKYKFNKYKFNKYDEDYNLFFRCFNSSLNSFGEANQIILKKIILPIINLERGKIGKIEYLLKILNKSTEHGTQYYDVDSINPNEMAIINGASRPLVISFAHHPIESLHYEQIYNDKKGINQILKHSHLHLTSHEHINPNFFHYYHNDRTLVLKSGKFSNTEFRKKSKEVLTEDSFESTFSDNWFTILEVPRDRVNPKVIRKNYKFEVKSFENINSSEWKMVDNKEFALYNKNDNGSIREKLNKEIEASNLNKLVENFNEFTKLYNQYKEKVSNYLTINGNSN